jgi:ribokinase
MAKSTILTVGSLNMDQIIPITRMPSMGETLLGTGQIQLVPGGKGANQAVALARLGAAVGMAGRVGHDPFGADLLKALQADQVDITLVMVDEHEASGVAFIFLSPAGENAIVVAAGANSRMGEDLDQMERISRTLVKAQALVLQLEIPPQTVKRLVAAGYQNHVPVVLNLAPVQALPLETLRQLTALIVNETEARLLHAMLHGPQSSQPPLRSMKDAASLATKLHELGIPTVIITLGAQGAVLAHTGEAGQTECLEQAPPNVTVKDTTAAGDCFTGAFTVALTEGLAPAEALRFSVYASALKVTKFGAQSGLPTRSEVEELLRSV